MTPEEAKASLGLATRLSEEFLMQQMAQEQAMMGEEAPMEGEMPQGEEMGGMMGEMPHQENGGDMGANNPMLDQIQAMLDKNKADIIQELKKEDGTGDD